MNTIRVAGLTAAASAVVFLLSTLPASAQPIPQAYYAGKITGCDGPTSCGTVQFRMSQDGSKVQNFTAYDVDGMGSCRFVGGQEYPGDLDIVGDSFGPGTLDWYQVSGSFSSEGDAQGTFRLAPHPPDQPPGCDTGLLHWTATVQPVGGIAELPDVSGSSAANYIPLAAVAAAALVALTAGGWHARRRRLG
jgi:hypothetical protein